MTKYYRFISQAEYEALLLGEQIKSPNGRIHLFEENSTIYETPVDLNYKIRPDEIHKMNFPTQTIPYHKIQDFVIGITSDDYLVELTDIVPTSIQLGWYTGLTDETEFVIVEFLRSNYSLENVSKIYTASDFSKINSYNIVWEK